MESIIFTLDGVSIELRDDGLFRKAKKGRIGGWVGTPHDMTQEQAIALQVIVWKREQDGTDLSGKTTTIKFNKKGA